MKTLYSSAFFSLILGFFVLLQSAGHPLTLAPGPAPSFGVVERGPSIQKPGETITIQVFEQLDISDSLRLGRDVLAPLMARAAADETFSITILPVANEAQAASVEPAKGLLCAEFQGLLPAVYGRLHELADPWTKTRVLALMDAEGLDLAAFRACRDEGQSQNALRQNAALAAGQGVTVFPTLFINEYRLYGYHPPENVDRLIRKIKTAQSFALPSKL